MSKIAYGTLVAPNDPTIESFNMFLFSYLLDSSA